MAKVLTHSISPTGVKNNADNIAGAGVGMVLATLAQNLANTNPCKSWLIILAPPVTLLIKYCWNLFAAEAKHVIKMKRVDKAHEKVIRQIDAIMLDPNISTQKRKILQLQKEEARLSMVQERIRYLERIRSS